jgi:hypothetical protein
MVAVYRNEYQTGQAAREPALTASQIQKRSVPAQSRSTYSVDALAICRENFYTPPLAGERTHVQCAKKTP